MASGRDDVATLIASLSSIPPRFAFIGATLNSLLAQRHRPDRVLLYIPRTYRRFPEWDGTLPAVPQGVEIRRVNQDLGPATKVLQAVREFRGEDADIAFFDDDRIYDPLLTTRLLAESARHPGCCIAENGYHLERITGEPPAARRTPRAVRRWRATDLRFQLAYAWQDLRHWPRRHSLREPPRRVNKRAGHIDILEGSGGALVRPEMFGDDAFDIPPVLWSVDDVWLSGMLEKNGVPIWLPANILEQKFSDAETRAPLSLSVNEGADRDRANRLAVEHMRKTYGIWT